MRSRLDLGTHTSYFSVAMVPTTATKAPPATNAQSTAFSSGLSFSPNSLR